MAQSNALTAAMISGGVSIVVNLFSIGIQHYLNKRRKQKEDRDVWYRNLISDVEEVKRTAMLLSGDIEIETSEEGGPVEIDGENNLRVLEDCIDTIERQQRDMPPELKGTKIDSEMSKLISTYKDIGLRDENVDVFYLKNEIIQQSENVLDRIEENYERAEDLY